jgi:hypothetical protein
MSIIHDPENSADLREKGSYHRREKCQAGSGVVQFAPRAWWLILFQDAHSRLEISKYAETIGKSVRLWGDKAALGCPLEDAQSVKAFRQIFFQPPRIERSD